MKITSAEFVTSAVEKAGWPEEGLPEFAFVGRSNVGKSSLLNLLTGRKDLAKVSSTPGATQTVNFFRVNGRWSLVDLPGYGYSKTPKSMRGGFQQAVSEYLTEREPLKCVFVLIDARHEPQRIDLEFCDWLAVSGVPFVLVFTKTDKLKKGKVTANVGAFLTALAERVDGEPRVFLTSAKDRSGKDEVLGFVGKALEV